MISSTLEYALRAVTWLAARPGEGMPAQKIAEATQVPEDYLSKVLQQLARGGVLTSQRGRNGGFQLARPPAEISMLSVLNAVDKIPRIERCPLNLPLHGVKLCPLHRRLDAAYAVMEQAFRETTLAELVEDNRSRVALCEPRPEGLHVI